MSRHIFVTGGVVSSLGKGLTSASIGMLLESRGLKVRMQKLDPYLNVDPGTMSPFQHGEVYVLDDGSETDLDLGHYERFTSGELNRHSNYTTGQIYLSVIEKERRGEYLGRTVQVVPHITDEIKASILSLATPDVDVVITELGGTVGDIEGLPFLEAIRQIPLDIGRENCMFIHLTLVPYLKAAREAKTKPTQHSVQQLREIGISPDILIVRTERPIGREHTEKIALFCNVEKRAVIEEVDKEFSIYEVPVGLVEHGLDDLICQKLQLKCGPLQMEDYRQLVHRIRNPRHEVTIAVVGKYIEHRDAYKSIYESLDHAGFAHSTQIIVKRLEAEEFERQSAEMLLKGVDGLLVPGGFGMRGIEGKIQAIQYAREHELPFFGICLGMAVPPSSNSPAMCWDSKTPTAANSRPIPAIPSSVCWKSKRLSIAKAEPCDWEPNRVCSPQAPTLPCAYGVPEISERHRHRYEFNPEYRQQFTDAGMVIAGTSPSGTLVEVIELQSHPWFLAVQYHPEFKSKPHQPHPLFRDFVGACLLRRSSRSSS
ncbi:MAG UNVERIFIED_CONTAM: CTP synthase [Planctomycetaceae bacterium]|jgi:CTP synthase